MKIKKIDIMTAFFDRLSYFAKRDKKVFFITADHGAWALANFKTKHPNQYLNIGISEQNMVSVAAGMALGGHKVFIFTITPFLIHRALEQIKMDISYPNLPITVVGNGSSLTYANHGSSHQSIDDISIINNLPNFEIFHPSNNFLAKVTVDNAYKSKKPIYVKLDKGYFPDKKYNEFKSGIIKVYEPKKSNKNICIITTGVLKHELIKLIDNNLLTDVCIYEIFKIKPINRKKIINLFKKFKKIISIEEQHVNGGIGNLLSMIISSTKVNTDFKIMGIEDFFLKKNGNRSWLRKQYKIDNTNLLKKID